jgi:hypothetical protein
VPEHVLSHLEPQHRQLAPGHNSDMRGFKYEDAPKAPLICGCARSIFGENPEKEGGGCAYSSFGENPEKEGGGCAYSSFGDNPEKEGG